MRAAPYVLCLQIKQPSVPALYQLASADIFAFPKKQSHIAKLIQLPPAGQPVMAGDVALPPLLIFNLQLPLYMVSGWVGAGCVAGWDAAPRRRGIEAL